MNAAEILISALTLIDTPEKWIKGALAKDAKGRSVPTTGNEGVCFCSVGAISHTFWKHDVAVSDKPYSFLREAMSGSITTRNDHEYVTHSQIMREWKEAISRAAMHLKHPPA